MDFYDLDLNDYVLDALDDMNFTDTTPIQEHAIPPILEGRDVMGVAQTGTGKTAAYLLPVLSLLADGGFPKDAINCIIMSPTRELAQQIDSAMQGFAYYLDDISSVAVYGGNDGIRYEQEKRAMQSGADVVIATPGRLISHLSLGNIDLSRVSFFILDEADRMLDMGFCDDILLIAKALPKEHQTIMFSATMPGDILNLAHTILRNPVEVKLAVSKPADNIRQSAYICYEPQKLLVVKRIFEQEPPHRVIIFVGSKKKTKELAISIIRAGYNARAMHSDLSQAERDEVMYLFRSGKIDILVATDIVAVADEGRLTFAFTTVSVTFFVSVTSVLYTGTIETSTLDSPAGIVAVVPAPTRLAAPCSIPSPVSENETSSSSDTEAPPAAREMRNAPFDSGL